MASGAHLEAPHEEPEEMEMAENPHWAEIVRRNFPMAEEEEDDSPMKSQQQPQPQPHSHALTISGHEASADHENVVFCQKDLSNVSFPVMEDIRRMGKLCDVTIKVKSKDNLLKTSFIAFLCDWML